MVDGCSYGGHMIDDCSHDGHGHVGAPDDGPLIEIALEAVTLVLHAR